MKITGKTVERPSIDYMYDKYRGLLERLNELILDLKLFQEVQHYLIHLEWCDLFYELINQEHGNKLARDKQQSEYERFYENIFEQVIKLKPYLYFTEEPKLNIPYKQSHSHQELRELLSDNNEALELIYEFYPFVKKRNNKREANNEQIEKFFDMLNDSDRYLKAAKWKYVQAVKNKEFVFYDVFPSQAITLEDEKGNTYSEFIELSITDINDKIELLEDIDYEIHKGGAIVILSPLLHKCKDIKIKITTKLLKFKQISN